jgi:hypothetical protein
MGLPPLPRKPPLAVRLPRQVQMLDGRIVSDISPSATTNGIGRP